jgi:hypothetical protein
MKLGRCSSFAVLLPLIFADPFPVAAQSAAVPAAQSTPTPEAMQAANDLFGILGKDMVQNFVATAMVQAWPPIDTDLTLKKVDKTTIASLQKEYERLQTESISAALKDLPAVYARHFNASEIRELIAFYQTPIGKKLVQEMPKAQTELQAILTPRLQEAQAGVFVSFRKVMRQRGLVD